MSPISNWKRQTLIKMLYESILRLGLSLLIIGRQNGLIESVLQGIHVYWMTLFSSPVSILSRMRAKLFHFLWSGSSKNGKFHLVAWDKLSIPHDMGGWGFKHLSHFNASLCAKSLWRCMFGKCLWKNLIKGKYFRGLDTIFWIRDGSKVNPRASIIWKSMARTFPFIPNDLSW